MSRKEKRFSFVSAKCLVTLKNSGLPWSGILDNSQYKIIKSFLFLNYELFLYSKKEGIWRVPCTEGCWESPFLASGPLKGMWPQVAWGQHWVKSFLKRQTCKETVYPWWTTLLWFARYSWSCPAPVSSQTYFCLWLPMVSALPTIIFPYSAFGWYPGLCFCTLSE